MMHDWIEQDGGDTIPAIEHAEIDAEHRAIWFALMDEMVALDTFPEPAALPSNDSNVPF